MININKEQLNDMNVLDFIKLILLKEQSALEPQDPIFHKISSAIGVLEQIKEEGDGIWTERFIFVTPLSQENFIPNMWVWNDTKSMYQKIRYSPVQDGSYHWVDGQNNIIENDVLYRFMF